MKALYHSTPLANIMILLIIFVLQGEKDDENVDAFESANLAYDSLKLRIPD